MFLITRLVTDKKYFLLFLWSFIRRLSVSVSTENKILFTIICVKCLLFTWARLCIEVSASQTEDGLAKRFAAYFNAY